MTFAEAVIDHGAIAHNVALLNGRTDSQLMAVVKANAFGHGAVPVARTALASGARWLGVTSTAEAMELREAGIEAPVLAWMWLPSEPVIPALKAGVDLSISSGAHLRALARQARKAGVTGAVHLKIDTGLHRGGASPQEWLRLIELAFLLEQEGVVAVRGLWTHLTHPDAPHHPDVADQLTAFDAAVTLARDGGLEAPLRHVANSAAILDAPETHYDMVRAGLAIYGIEPVPGKTFGLRPAMAVSAQILMTREVRAGSGVSYGHAYRTPQDSTLALLPVGYADGIPTSAPGAEVLVRGIRRPIAGRVTMDQCVVDAGFVKARIGDRVVVFGDGSDGAPTAAEWAGWSGTCPHDILTGIGPRVGRRHVPIPTPVSTTDPRIRVALLFGGWGGEYEVSRASAAAVLEALDPSRYEVLLVHLCRSGDWVTGDESVALAARGRGAAALAGSLTPEVGVTLAASFRAATGLLRTVDVVFPAIHGTYGEDGRLQSVLDGLAVPYVGSGVLASAAGMNKVVTKRLAAAQGIAVAEGVVLRPAEDGLTAQQKLKLGLPVFVKPARSGSSLGVTRVDRWVDLPSAVSAARAHDASVMVEQAVIGREVDVAVIEHPDGRLEAGPPLEIRVGEGRPFFDFDAKYSTGSSHFEIPASLDPALTQRLKSLALLTFRTLGCTGLLRIDFLLRDGVEPVLNEVNTLPGLTSKSQFPQIWKAAGVSYPDLLDLLLTTAISRPSRRRSTRRIFGGSYPFEPEARRVERRALLA